MNWTKDTPVEGVKYIVRTDTQKLFPAYWENGGWWHSQSETEVFNVCAWVVYPERYSKSNDKGPDVPKEVLLKYAVRDYRKMKEIAKGESEKVTELKKLNKNLVTEYNTLLTNYRELKRKSELNASIAEAKLEKKRVKNRELAEKLGKAMDKLAGLEEERTEKLKSEISLLKQELIDTRKEDRKGRTLHGNLRKLLERFAALDDNVQEDVKEESVE